MRPTSIVIALSSALDVDAARRLNDYGDLDDAGVARALEQVHMQRWGRTDCPAHLRRITGIAAVVEHGRTLRVLEFDAGTSEADLLSALLADCPVDAGTLVDWSGEAGALLLARACRHALVVPGSLSMAERVALAERVAPARPGHPAAPSQVEDEYHQLHDRTVGAGSLKDRAVARYRAWLAWQVCCGDLLAVEHTAREDALGRELSNQD